MSTWPNLYDFPVQSAGFIVVCIFNIPRRAGRPPFPPGGGLPGPAPKGRLLPGRSPGGRRQGQAGAALGPSEQGKNARRLRDCLFGKRRSGARIRHFYPAGQYEYCGSEEHLDHNFRP